MKIAKVLLAGVVFVTGCVLGGYLHNLVGQNTVLGWVLNIIFPFAGGYAAGCILED